MDDGRSSGSGALALAAALLLDEKKETQVEFVLRRAVPRHGRRPQPRPRHRQLPAGVPPPEVMIATVAQNIARSKFLCQEATRKIVELDEVHAQGTAIREVSRKLREARAQRSVSPR